jgi:predicted negative regulator of RcsB-dependent stress response
MELHDAPAHYFFKLWPWIEANRTRLMIGGGIVIVGAGLISFRSYQRTQREIDAGTALTQAMMADPRNNTVDQQAGLFMKVAEDYSGTAAAQQFLKQYSSSTLAAQAALGLASCLDAQGKTDPAAAAYQQVLKSYSDSAVALHAKFRLAQINEQQGKITDALNLYEDLARANPNTSLGSDAGLRAMELKMTTTTAPAPSPVGPVKLTP